MPYLKHHGRYAIFKCSEGYYIFESNRKSIYYENVNDIIQAIDSNCVEFGSKHM